MKAGSRWHQAETAEDPQNINKFAAGSLEAVTAHRIKWILSGRSAVEQMRHSPFATCGNDQCRSEDLCVLTSADLPSTSLSSSLHAPFTPSTPGSQVPGVVLPCSPLHQVRGGVSPSRGNASKTRASLPQATVEQNSAQQTRVRRLLSTMLAVYELQAQ